MTAYGYIKAAIPVLNPFSWDVTFAHADRALFFGRDAYELLWPLTFTALVTGVLNAFYNFWFLALNFVVLVACFTRDQARLRLTFLTSFTLVWALGGNLLAIVFSSAGPAFYSKLGFGEDYEPLMQALIAFDRVIPVWVLDGQELLWRGYTDPTVPALGISAMPSMHLASSALMAVAAWCWRRWAGWLAWAFTTVIFVGSIQLAYHYAVDGLAGIALALGLWKVARVLVDAVAPDLDYHPASASRAT